MYKVFFFLCVTIASCRCAAPTVTRVKAVSISTQVIYQAAEDSGDDDIIAKASDEYHAERVKSLDNVGVGELSSSTPSEETPSPEAAPTEGMSCSAYVREHNYVHLEKHLQDEDGNVTDEEILTNDTVVVCLY